MLAQATVALAAAPLRDIVAMSPGSFAKTCAWPRQSWSSPQRPGRGEAESAYPALWLIWHGHGGRGGAAAKPALRRHAPSEHQPPAPGMRQLTAGCSKLCRLCRGTQVMSVLPSTVGGWGVGPILQHMQPQYSCVSGMHWPCPLHCSVCLHAKQQQHLRRPSAAGVQGLMSC